MLSPSFDCLLKYCWRKSVYKNLEQCLPCKRIASETNLFPDDSRRPESSHYTNSFSTKENAHQQKTRRSFLAHVLIFTDFCKLEIEVNRAETKSENMIKWMSDARFFKIAANYLFPNNYSDVPPYLENFTQKLCQKGTWSAVGSNFTQLGFFLSFFSKNVKKNRSIVSFF